MGNDDILDVVNRLFISTDNRDWNAVEGCFAEQVLFDQTSMTGGEPVVQTPSQISAGWEKGLKPLRAIHHQTGNFIVTRRERDADVFCYGIAFHYLPNPTGRNTRTFVGSYDFHLARGEDGWRIDRFRFNLKFIDGNPDLERS